MSALEQDPRLIRNVADADAMVPNRMKKTKVGHSEVVANNVDKQSKVFDENNDLMLTSNDVHDSQDY
jgi:hypothetical protein